MNAGFAYTIESLFGPASEIIDITDFLNSAGHVLTETSGEEETVASTIADECSVAEIRDSLSNVWNNATLSAHLIKDHDRIVSALHAIVSPKNSKSTRKSHLPDPQTLPVEVNGLQKNIDSVTLKTFKLDTQSVLFMRTSKNSDYNTLTSVKSAPGTGATAKPGDGLVIISVYDKIAWGPSYVARSSQHVLLCTQTLQDLYDCIPCASKHLLTEPATMDTQTECVIILEDRVYDSCLEEGNYTDKLFKHLEILSKGKTLTNISKAPTSTKNTTISSLSVRINKPYWLLHAGNCEHFVVFNQIRNFHPLDPLSGYPLTLQNSPALLDLCRACNKVPAVLSILGDIRLGESPCVLCRPCWRNMGESHDENVVTLRIPDRS